MWILDTDHYSLLLRGHPSVFRRVTALNPQEMTITIVTAEEQLRGRLNGIRQASQPTRRDRLIEAYELLQGTLRDLNSIPTLDFDQVADTLYTELLHQKIRIGTRDLRIGAIALSTNAIVVTRNQRDFSQIPGLMLEDWTIL